MAFDKEEYWKRRKEGKRGVPLPPKPTVIRDQDGDKNIGFDVNGNMILKNRAWRRQPTKLPVDKPKPKSKRKK